MIIYVGGQAGDQREGGASVVGGMLYTSFLKGMIEGAPVVFFQASVATKEEKTEGVSSRVLINRRDCASDGRYRCLFHCLRGSLKDYYTSLTRVWNQSLGFTRSIVHLDGYGYTNTEVDYSRGNRRLACDSVIFPPQVIKILFPCQIYIFVYFQSGFYKYYIFITMFKITFTFFYIIQIPAAINLL